MAKKASIALFAAVTAIFFFVLGRFITETGILRNYPEPKYFSDADAEIRPVYQGLSKKEKAVYEALYRGITEHKESIGLPYEVNGDTYSKLYCLVEKQESELFYADSSYYKAEKIREAKIIYREDESEILDKVQEFDKAVDLAYGRIIGDGDEYRTALRIHDYLIDNCRYVTGEDIYSSTAYGCLVEKKANCEGYAKAFDLLASKMGLKSILVTGVTDKGENHAWNQVSIDGEWYNLDVTWDDTDVTGDSRKNYFLCNDEKFGKTHIAETDYFTPFECNAEDGAYYIRSGLYITSMDSAEKILHREMSSGKTMIELKFSSSEIYDDFIEEFITDQRIFEVWYECGGNGRTMSLSENRSENCLSIYFAE